MYHPSLNLGIEEEYQLIDPDSRELLGFVSQSMGRDKTQVYERNPDLNFSRVSEGIVEAGTTACADVAEAESKLRQMRTTMLELAEREGLKVIAAGTHPFSRWETRTAVVPRYQALVEDTQMLARRMLAFGLHIHVGIEDRELAIDVMNTMRYVLPHMLCLGTSSPFWMGRNTGLKSYRSVLLDALPRTGIPGEFPSYQEYRHYVDTLVRTHSIQDPSRIYYDILPHYRLPTLVVRICDMLPSWRDTLAIAALVQGTAAWMVDLRRRNLSFRLFDRILVEENKWLAVRYGLTGKLVDFGIEQPVPAPDLIRELLGRIEPAMSQLNTLDQAEHIQQMLERGASADQQLAVWQEAGEDARAVVDHLIAETEKI